MVNSCCAYNCKARFKKGGPSFFRFPNNKEMKQEWVVALRRKNFNPTNSTRICEKHFEKDCFEPMKWTKNKKLKETAVPTIFDFPAGYKFKKTRKPPKDSLNNSEGAQVGPVVEKTHALNALNFGAQISNEPVIFVEKVAEKVCGPIDLSLPAQISNEPAIFGEKVRESNNSNVEKEIGPMNIITENFSPILRNILEKDGKNEATTENVCPNCVTLEGTAAALSKAQTSLKEQKKKIKMLQQKVRRQEQKIKHYLAYSKALYQRVEDLFSK